MKPSLFSRPHSGMDNLIASSLLTTNYIKDEKVNKLSRIISLCHGVIFL